MSVPDKELLPRHIGIIMDGNGRWAKKRLLPRTAGHVQGARAFRKCMRYCADIGIECVTFYAFSTENRKRPKEEVNAIMKLFSDYLDEGIDMSEKDISMRFIGDIDWFSDSLRDKMKRLQADTASNRGMVCCLAVNYGGRDDILHAAKQLLTENADPAALTEEMISERLYTGGLPDVDLIIRPSGEQRLSNFLIWQAAYAEYVFMDVLWPDFSEKDLDAALEEYAGRNRRFGGL
ncbi:MAG: di-trans,poly-cis-decaprenylcistransferase [Ruminiclostridium sp.]|nr:di-trans,poly-cis-decaprenylcistransferase [Ruminiclostridium sp.]